MAKKINVTAEVETTTMSVSVTSAPGGAGTAIAYTSASSALTITNTSGSCDVQYKVNSGSWVELERNDGASLPLNFASDLVYLRRATLDGGLSTVDLAIDGVPTIAAGASRLVTATTAADGGTTSIVSANGVPMAQQAFDAYLPGRAIAKMDGTDGTLTLISAGANEAVAIDSTTFAIPMVKCTLSTTAAAVFQADYTLTTPIYAGGFTSLQFALAFGDMSATELSGSLVQAWLYTASGGYIVKPQFSMTYQEPGKVFVASFARDCVWNGSDAPNRLEEDLITKIRITITAGSSSAGKAPVWLGPISVNTRRKKGSVIIYADGEYTEINKYLLPMLDNYGLKCNLALVVPSIVAGNGATPSRMNRAMLDAAYANKHIPIIHTNGPATQGWDNAISYPAVGGDNGYASILAELQGGDATLDSYGMPEGKSHRVNGFTNAYDPSVSNARQIAISAAMTTAGTKTCRVGAGYQRNSLGGVGMLHPAAHPLANWRRMMGCLQIDTNFNTADFSIAQVDAAAQRGELAALLIHHPSLNSVAVPALGMNLANLELVIEHIAARVSNGEILCETIDIAYKRIKGT